MVRSSTGDGLLYFLDSRRQCPPRHGHRLHPVCHTTSPCFWHCACYTCRPRRTQHGRNTPRQDDAETLAYLSVFDRCHRSDGRTRLRCDDHVLSRCATCPALRVSTRTSVTQ